MVDNYIKNQFTLSGPRVCTSTSTLTSHDALSIDITQTIRSIMQVTYIVGPLTAYKYESK